jgi:hypothetical protein
MVQQSPFCGKAS